MLQNDIFGGDAHVGPKLLKAIEVQQRELWRARLSNTGLAVLVTIHSRGPQSIGALAADLRHSKPNISRAVDQLQNRKFAARIPSTTDRRVVNVKLTTAGDKFLTKLVTAMATASEPEAAVAN